MSSAGHGVHVYGSEALADDAAGHGRQIFAGSSAPSASRSTSTLPSAHAQSPVAASRPSVSSADSESRRSSSSTTTGTGADTLTASTVGPPWHGRHCVPSRVGARPADAHAVHDHAAGVDELSTAGVYVSTPAVHSHESPSSLEGVWPVGHCRQLSDEMSRYLSAAGQVGMGTESDWAETSGRSARIAANRHFAAVGGRR